MMGTGERNRRLVVRIVGGLILAIAAVGDYSVWRPHSATSAADVSNALLNDSINQKSPRAHRSSRWSTVGPRATC